MLNTTRILIADRHRLHAETLAASLCPNPDLSVLITRGLDFFPALAAHAPDLLIVDLCLPDIGGRQLIGEVHLLNPAIRLLAISDHDGPGYRECARELGANGFVWKGATLSSLRNAVSRIMEGADWISVPESFVPGGECWITDRDHQILECLVEYPIKAIGGRLGMGTRKVEAGVQRLRKAFRVNTNTKLIQEAFRLGYLASRPG
jgi:DNA-binding NarL/FixJ family response regulator